MVYVFWNFCIVVEIFESKGGVKKYKSSKVLVFVVNIRGFEDNMLLRVFEIDGWVFLMYFLVCLVVLLVMLIVVCEYL